MADDTPPTDAKRRDVVGAVIGRVAPVVLNRIDLDAIVDQLDVDAIAQRLDLDALIGRLDMDAIVDQLDVNAIADQLDLDALVSRLDVNAIADQLDIDALMSRIDMAQLTGDVTADVATSGLDLVRRQLVRMDATVDGVVGRVLRRDPADRPDAPAGLAEPPVPDAPPSSADDDEAPLQRRDVSGHYAGPVTRLLALAGDVSAAVTGFGLFGAVGLYFVNVVTGGDLSLGSGGWVNVALFVAWMLLWFWAPVALFGRTLVMAVLGIAVVTGDGGVASSGRAFVRAIVLPVSLGVFLLGLVGIVLGRQRRALHDVAAGTVVVYDWGERQAQQPVSIRDQLSARVRRPVPEGDAETG